VIRKKRCRCAGSTGMVQFQRHFSHLGSCHYLISRCAQREVLYQQKEREQLASVSLCRNDSAFVSTRIDGMGCVPFVTATVTAPFLPPSRGFYNVGRRTRQLTAMARRIPQVLLCLVDSGGGLKLARPGGLA